MTDKTSQANAAPKAVVTEKKIDRALDAFEAAARNVAAPEDLGKSWRAESSETKADIRECMRAALSTDPGVRAPETQPTPHGASENEGKE